jgi:hypothetical protein
MIDHAPASPVSVLTAPTLLSFIVISACSPARRRILPFGRQLSRETEMTMKIERFQPEGMNVRMSGGQPSYSHVVTVSGTGKIV